MTTKEITVTQEQPLTLQPPSMSPLAILEAAVRGGITKDSVAVVKELAAMCREQRAEDAKAEFARAFFEMKKQMPTIYADKEVKTKNGTVAFEYCSPQEIQDAIDPILKKNGFCTMTGQTKDANGCVTATVTLFHQGGHSETRSFTVRAGSGNSLMNETQCDAGATTSAERHLLVKMLGLRTRVATSDDARVLGSPITSEQVSELKDLVKGYTLQMDKFLKWMAVGSIEEIPAAKFNRAKGQLEKHQGDAPQKDAPKPNAQGEYEF